MAAVCALYKCHMDALEANLQLEMQQMQQRLQDEIGVQVRLAFVFTQQANTFQLWAAISVLHCIPQHHPASLWMGPLCDALTVCLVNGAQREVEEQVKAAVHYSQYLEVKGADKDNKLHKLQDAVRWLCCCNCTKTDWQCPSLANGPFVSCSIT